MNVPLEYPVRTSVGIVAKSPLVPIDLHTDAGDVGHSHVLTCTPLGVTWNEDAVARWAA